jgi:hypothetical protein
MEKATSPSKRNEATIPVLSDTDFVLSGNNDAKNRYIDEQLAPVLFDPMEDWKLRNPLYGEASRQLSIIRSCLKITGPNQFTFEVQKVDESVLSVAQGIYLGPHAMDLLRAFYGKGPLSMKIKNSEVIDYSVAPKK